MKKIITISMLIALLSGCTTKTEYGECIGVLDDKKPELIYKLDTTNAVLGIVFVETIFVPVIVLANETQCPVGKK